MAGGFPLRVSAADDAAVTNRTVIGLGPLAFFTNLPDGSPRVLAFTVPPNAVPGALFQFRAQATDLLGLPSPEVTVDLAVTDGTAPTVSLVSPAADTLLAVAQPFVLAVAAADNSTNYTLAVVLRGPVSATQTVSVVNAANRTVTNLFSFSLSNVVTAGATLTATVTTTDANTNRATAMRTFRVPDTRAQQLFAANPTNAAPRQSLWAGALPGVSGGATADGPGLVLRMLQVQPVPGPPAAPLAAPLVPAMNSPARRWNVVLEWAGPPSGSYTIEASTDLQTWWPVPLAILSAPDGVFRVRCEVLLPAATFYRLRHLP